MNFKKKTALITTIITIVLIIIVVVLINNDVFNKKLTYYEVESRVNNVTEENTIGWIRVQGTNIDYPVISSYNENIDAKTDDFAWINDNQVEGLRERTLLYGHNIMNLSIRPSIADPSHKRFEQLMSFAYYSFAKENQYIQYSDQENDYIFEIYSISYYDTYYETGESNMSVSEKGEYIKDSLANSLYDYGVEPTEDDKLITLSTCTRMFGVYDYYHLKVDGVLINEKPLKKIVTKTEKYDTIEEMISGEDVVIDDI